MAGLLEQGEEALNKAFTTALVFSFLIVIIAVPLEDVIGVQLFCTTTAWHENCAGLPMINWATGSLVDAIEKLQQGGAFNLLVAAPQLVISGVGLVAEAMINALILVNTVIYFIIRFIFILVPALGESYASTLSGILAWAIELPLIFGMLSEIGKMMYLFLTGGGSTGG